MKSLINIFLFIFITFNLGCKSDDPGTPEPEVGTGTVRMHLHTYIDESEVDGYNINYTTTAENRKISLSIAQFYISNIRLVKADGSIHALPETVVLKVLETNTFTLGDVPAGNYKSIIFNVGLNPTTNLKVPTSSSTDILNKPEMWFGATAQPDGYVFLNVQGKIDTTVAANASIVEMQDFVYKIGTDANYKEVVMPDNPYTVTANQTQYIHMIADCSKLFNGIQLINSSNLTVASISDNSTGIATAIKNNIPAMFKYE